MAEVKQLITKAGKLKEEGEKRHKWNCVVEADRLRKKVKEEKKDIEESQKK